MRIQIEKGVPAPKQTTRSGKYPFRDMVVGDSFFITDENPEPIRKKISSAACMFCKKNDKYKFKTQVFDTGVRVWRVQ
jgi:hypothetical protein